jgi:hypothetical protein
MTGDPLPEHPDQQVADPPAIVVTGAGVGGGYVKSIRPDRTLHIPGTGSQKYSSSVRPASRGRS